MKDTIENNKHLKEIRIGKKMKSKKNVEKY